MKYLWQLVLVIGAYVTIPAYAEAPSIIRVSGEGEVNVTPDIAFLQVGASAQADTAQKAQAETTTKINAIRGVLNAAGIKKEDIKTTELSLYPIIDYGKNNKQSIRGFNSQQSYRVKVRKVDTVGDLVTKITAAGANISGGISFALDNPKPAQDEARKLAVGDAKQKAQLYAAAAQVKLGRILSITDVMNDTTPIVAYEAMADGASAKHMAQAPTVEQGQMSISSGVTMVFAIAP